MLLSCLWPIYKRDRTIARYSHFTLRAHEVQFNVLLRYIGDVDADSITADMLKDYFASCDHLKTSSLAMKIRVMKAFFNWAYTEGHMTSNPTATIKEPRIRDKTPKYLSDDEIVTLKSGCESILEKTLLEFSFATGCRVGEVNRINLEDINWDNNSINIMGKGERKRLIYFSEPCKDLLRQYLSIRDDEDHALFVTERAPHRMSIAEMRYILKRIATRSGIGINVYPHKLRHTYATHLINNGANLEAIRQLMGHSNLSSTMIYAHLTEEGKHNAYKKCFRD